MPQPGKGGKVRAATLSCLFEVVVQKSGRLYVSVWRPGREA
jgi:hypothetical protein